MAEDTYIDIVLRDIFWLSRILGTFPFDHNFEVNFRTKTRSISILIFLFLCSSTHVFDFRTRRTLKIVFISFANFLSFVVLIVKKEYVLLMNESLLKVEKDMLYEGIHPNWSPTHFKMYLRYYVFMFLLLVTAYVHFQFSNISQIFFMLLPYMISFSLSLSVINQFSTLQGLLDSLFDKLLESKNIKGILSILTNLHTAGGAIKSIYGLHILFFTTTIFIFLVCNIYYEFRCEYPTWIKVLHKVWILLISYPLVEIISSSNRTATNARKLNDKLYEKMLEDIKNSHIQNELLEFHLTCGKELKFDACGFFLLDNSLICSMIGSATTYMVILMQYTNSTLACDARFLNDSAVQPGSIYNSYNYSNYKFF